MASGNPIHTVKEGIAAAKDRRRASGFRFVIADSIAFVNAEHWDSLSAGESLFFSRGYLRILEESGPRQIQPRYAVIYRDRQPIAALALQVIRLKATQLVGESSAATAESKWKKTTDTLRDQALKGVRRKVLICGNLLSWGQHGIVIAKGERAADVWPGITEALYRIRRSEKLSGQTHYVMVKDLPVDENDGAEVLRRFSYRPLETDPDMVLELPAEWRTYDDYLSSLNKKYRKSIRTIAKTVTDAGCTVEELTNLDANKTRLHSLYKQVQSRADVRLVSLPDDYLPALVAELGPERIRCTVIRRGDDILGFVTTLKDGENGIGYYIGVDYEANAEIPVYLRLLNAVVEDGIALGCRRISFGRTALEPKARLGAQPVPMRVWVRHRIPLVNYAVRQLFQAVPHHEPPERNPFKA